jgi:hypothetical protein
MMKEAEPIAPSPLNWKGLETALRITGLIAVLTLFSPPSPLSAQTCNTIIVLLQQGRSPQEIASLTGLSVGDVEACRAQVVLPPAGPPPHGAPGPAPRGASGVAPHGAAGPAPHGAAGVPPHGAAGPAPHGAAGPAPGRAP